jgi:hypothetical protein
MIMKLVSECVCVCMCVCVCVRGRGGGACMRVGVRARVLALDNYCYFSV